MLSNLVERRNHNERTCQKVPITKMVPLPMYTTHIVALYTHKAAENKLLHLTKTQYPSAYLSIPRKWDMHCTEHGDACTHQHLAAHSLRDQRAPHCSK